MRRPGIRYLLLACVVTAAVSASGCTDPDAPGANSRGAMHSVRRVSGNAGEPVAPPPPSAASDAPARVQSTPAAALEAFAEIYMNWTYRTLNARQQELSGISVGSARLAERQAAAASAADGAIQRGKIHDSGEVLGVAPDQAQAGMWVVVTREQTSGGTQYEGLPAGYHVTLARLARVPRGYAVSEWLPQS
jgi:hypothetical protein